MLTPLMCNLHTVKSASPPDGNEEGSSFKIKIHRTQKYRGNIRTHMDARVCAWVKSRKLEGFVRIWINARHPRSSTGGQGQLQQRPSGTVGAEYLMIIHDDNIQVNC